MRGWDSAAGGDVEEFQLRVSSTPEAVQDAGSTLRPGKHSKGTPGKHDKRAVVESGRAVLLETRLTAALK